MKIGISLLTLLAFFATCRFSAAEEFSWTWGDGESAAAEKTSETSAPSAQAQETAAAAEPAQTPQVVAVPADGVAVPEETAKEQAVMPKKDESFAWAWEKEQPKPQESKAADAASETKPTVESSVEEAAKTAETTESANEAKQVENYNDLVKENLDLRQKIDETSRDKEAVRKENARLGRQIKDLTDKIQEAVAKIENLKKDQKEQATAPENLDKTTELEAKLSKAEAEKEQLAKDLAEAKTRLTATEAQPPSPVTGAAIDENKKMYRDLKKDYYELEKQNQVLKEELARLQNSQKSALAESEAASKKSESAAREADAIREKMDTAKNAEKEHRAVVEKLSDKVSSLESELGSKRSELKDKERKLADSEKNIEELKTELKDRDRRLEKAERMCEMIDQSRKDVGAIANAELRNMYYNMAVVYAKEGRYKDAEREYLQALSIDPSDADVHYNLAVLYDDSLKDSDKAVMHYKLYLKLNPSANDADIVKTWILQAEVGR